MKYENLYLSILKPKLCKNKKYLKYQSNMNIYKMKFSVTKQ